MSSALAILLSKKPAASRFPAPTGLCREDRVCAPHAQMRSVYVGGVLAAGLRSEQSMGRKSRGRPSARPRLRQLRARLLPLAGEEVRKKLRRLRLAVEGLVAEQLPGRAGENRDA